jgi:hypothetical protein
MGEAFIGSEAIASGTIMPYTLRSRFVALYPDVYMPLDSDLTAIDRARAAWLWSGRQASSRDNRPNRRPPRGIHTWSDRVVDDEVEVINGIRVTTPARTALDLACRYPVDKAVAAVDALAHATQLKIADVELLADRYQGRRSIRRARTVLDLVDSGAESPQETWLRLLVIRNGFPRPQTQIPVYDEFGVLAAVLDLGWEDVKIAMDTEGGIIRRLSTVWSRRT